MNSKDNSTYTKFIILKNDTDDNLKSYITKKKKMNLLEILEL